MSRVVPRPLWRSPLSIHSNSTSARRAYRVCPLRSKNPSFFKEVPEAVCSSACMLNPFPWARGGYSALQSRTRSETSRMKIRKVRGDSTLCLEILWCENYYAQGHGRYDG